MKGYDVYKWGHEGHFSELFRRIPPRSNLLEFVFEVEGWFFVVLLSILSHICKDQRSNHTFQQYCTILPKAMAEAIMGFTPFKSHTLSSCLQTNKFQVNQSSRLVKWSFDISISSHASNSKMKKKIWRCFFLLQPKQHSNSSLINRPWQVRISIHIESRNHV